jgi:ubiquinone/menaquinone biosynthesis C-methylase UbiE
MEAGMTGSKGYRGLAMEGPVASWYARNTGKDLGRFTGTADIITERVAPGGRILEIAPGPGYLAIELARRGFNVSAVDISRSFVEIVRRQAAVAGVPLDVRHGNASALPFGDAEFDYVVCMAAFKNFSDPVGALREMHRVLRPGGEASVFDLRRDADAGGIDQEIRRMRLSRVNALVTRLTFRFMLLKTAYSLSEIEQLVSATPFRRYELTSAGIGFELHAAAGVPA